MKNYIVGKSYRYSEIPEEDTEEFTVSEFGYGNLGNTAIHVRYHREGEIPVDVWFIWDNQGNEGIFKCVYNS